MLAGTKSYRDADRQARTGSATSPRSKPGDPRVGMIGGSYGGQIQYAVAMQDKRVDALIPIITWNDLSYSLAPNNTSLAHGVTYRTPGVAKKQWVDLFFSVGITDGVQGGSVDPSRNFPPCPNFADAACAGGRPAEHRSATRTPPRSRSRGTPRSSTYLERITAPTLLVQGQKDTLFNLQEAVATFRGLRAQGTPTRMIWQSWGHSDSTPAPGELDFDAKSLRDSYLGNRFLNWMNHYVKGSTQRPGRPAVLLLPRLGPLRHPPRVRRHRGPQGVRRASRRSPQAPTATLYFTGNDGLTRDEPRSRPAPRPTPTPARRPTSYSETSGLEGSQVNNPPSDAPGTFASFTTPPLAARADLVGSSRLPLHLSAPLAAQTQAADPAASWCCSRRSTTSRRTAPRRCTNRLISPVRVTDVTKPVRSGCPASCSASRPATGSG